MRQVKQVKFQKIMDIEFYESFERGSFAKSINAREGKEKKNSIKMLYQHDRKQVLGTPTLEEDEIGLKFHCEIAKDISYAKMLLH